ncbi:MAG: hydrogenase expression/formation protein HypE [Bacteroidetes bacterium]|nr:hydrogenase expression/formation protein HypE [Bacteroidota bacterium]
MSETLTDITAGLSCPVPKFDYDRVLLAHGGGGTLSHQLLSRVIFPLFKNRWLDSEHDGAVLEIDGVRLAFSTDSYVVQPIFFPGGNIGELAVNGTVNDIAMCGATPLFISAGFILEEGFDLESLRKIVESMRIAADRAGVSIVTGDTKVVDRGKGDKIFINTAGIGVLKNGIDISPNRCKIGDQILINGRIADHGVTIMSAREGLTFETTVESDTAPLNDLVSKILDVSNKIHVLRDPTRGGVASALNEIATKAEIGIAIDENSIPMDDQVKGACEILGLDPLYIANEGKLIVFVDSLDAEKVLEAMKSHPLGAESAQIGEVVADHPGRVVMKTQIGSSRIVDMLSGEQLPRIC